MSIYISNYFNSCNITIPKWYNEKEKFIKYYETKDEKLKQELINDNLRLISYTLREKLKLSKIEYDELVSYGYEGLIHAVENFNPYTNNKFSCYAILCIYGYIIHGIYTIKGLPENIFIKYYHEKNELRKENIVFDNKENEITEIFKRLVQKKLIGSKNVDSYCSLIRDKVNLDDIIEDNEVTYNNDDNILIDSMLKETMNEDIKNILDNNRDNINERDLNIIKYRYGLIDGKYHGFKEVGEKFNISISRAQIITFYVLEKLLKKENILLNLTDYSTIDNGEPNLSHKI